MKKYTVKALTTTQVVVMVMKALVFMLNSVLFVSAAVSNVNQK